MQFKLLAQRLAQIERTSSRNEMATYLFELVKDVEQNEAAAVVYLILGDMGPLYNRMVFDVSDALMARAIAEAYRITVEAVNLHLQRVGDWGTLAEQLATKSDKKKSSCLEVNDVFRLLVEVAGFNGAGSQEMKVKGLAGLFQSLDPVSVRYVARIPVGKLRLGFADMTILDALSRLVGGGKEVRKLIEGKYNIYPDIGRIAQLIKRSGVSGLAGLSVQVGVPIRPAAANRLPSAQAIIEKLGPVAAEPKIDGFRLQVHVDSRVGMVKLFSRNLEDMTDMFPEISKAVINLSKEPFILEGEAVAYNPETGEFLPFQETIQRKRKYDVSSKSLELPLRLFAFDLLYYRSSSQLGEPYLSRVAALAEVVGNGNSSLTTISSGRYDNPLKLQAYFEEQIALGLEGIVAKRLDAVYAAGARNNNWVKLKRDEQVKVEDTIDCVVLGYKFGKGKRNKFGIGAFLVGLYNKKNDSFETVSKVGTGLTDQQWMEMKSRADALMVDHQPVRYIVNDKLEQDVWIDPGMVVEIRADEITRSPVHSAGQVGDKPGFALRFPRLIRWRDDKSAEEATSVGEVKEMYAAQVRG